RDLLGHLHEADCVAEVRFGIEGFALHLDPALAWKIDLEDDADTGLLFVHRVDETAALAQIVNLHRNRQHTHPPPVERPRYASVLPALRAADFVRRPHGLQYSGRFFSRCAPSIQHGLTTPACGGTVARTLLV